MNINHVTAGLLALLFVSMPGIASEPSRIYLKPYAGISYMNDVKRTDNAINTEIELEKGMAFGAAVGYQFNPNVALELAWEYRSNDSETRVGNTFFPEGNYASNIFYVNSIYSFDAVGKWQPYLGLGLGWIQEIDLDLEQNGIEQSLSNSGNLTYQGFVGVEYNWSAAWSFHTELRHAGAKSGTLENELSKERFGSLNYKPFTWQVGAKYRF